MINRSGRYGRGGAAGGLETAARLQQDCDGHLGDRADLFATSLGDSRAGSGQARRWDGTSHQGSRGGSLRNDCGGICREHLPNGTAHYDGTVEDATEEDVDYLKAQIRTTKQQTLHSSRNAMRVVAQTGETAIATMNQLGSQCEMLNRIENRIDVSHVHAETAAEKAAHLKSLNRSMFLPHFRAPWSNKKRVKERIAKVEAEHLAAQQRKDNLRAQQRDTRNRAREVVGGSSGRSPTATGGLIGASHRASRDTPGHHARYQFEADEEDDAMERELDRNLDEISDAVGHLKNLALGMNSEIERQNGFIGRISGKVDVTGATLAGGSARLKSIQ